MPLVLYDRDRDRDRERLAIAAVSITHLHVSQSAILVSAHRRPGQPAQRSRRRRPAPLGHPYG